MPEHRNITDPENHEPKGISSALPSLVYISDGDGSGEWLKVDAATLQGLLSNSTSADRLVVTDGNGGLDSREAVFDSTEVTHDASSLETILNDFEARIAALENP